MVVLLWYSDKVPSDELVWDRVDLRKDVADERERQIPDRREGEPLVNRRQRLMATLRGEAVDRPAVNFYEIGGLRIDPNDADPFNVYHDPSWRVLWELAERETDLIRMRSAVRTHSHEAWDIAAGVSRESVREELMTIRDAGARTVPASRARRSPSAGGN